jgi:hypothetical protein
MPDFSGTPAAHGWIPHRPDTWPYKFARLKSVGEMNHYTGKWEGNEPQFEKVAVNAGQLVKIVMVSRFGDVGITENLTADVGYGMRVQLDDLYDFQETTTG